MKNPILTTALLVGSLPLLAARTDPATQQSLIAAKQQASLFHDQANPLQLEVDFLAQINVPTQGHLTLKWEAKDRWWRRIVMADFHEIEVRSGDRLYMSRNIGFTPVRIGELIRLLEFAEGSEEWLARKQKKRVEEGVEITCLQVERKNVRSKAHQVCINPLSHEILSDEWQEPPDERRREQYSDYFEFKGHRYPHKLELLVNGSKIITANVVSLTTTAFDEKLLVAPKGAIERRLCEDMKGAVPLKTPDPSYPRSASENKLMGDTAVAMTVLTDGSVTDIQLVGSAARSMDDATLRTLRTWKFKPAMCGAEPIVSDIEVVVSFRLR